MQKYVFSTASSHIAFVKYSEFQPNRVPQILRKVIVRGGANVAHGGGQKGLWTPRGIATPVSDDDLAFLNQDKKFNDMLRKGFMSVGFAEADAENAARDMTPKDRSAPKTNADFPGAGKSAAEIQQVAA